jgi:hypothetical protein
LQRLSVLLVLKVGAERGVTLVVSRETEITLTQKTYPATLYKTYDNRGVLFDDEGNATFYSRYRDAFRGAARKGLNREDILLVA